MVEEIIADLARFSALFSLLFITWHCEIASFTCKGERNIFCSCGPYGSRVTPYYLSTHTYITFGVYRFALVLRALCCCWCTLCCKLSPCPVLCCVCCKLSPCPVLCCVCCKLSPCPVLCCVCCKLSPCPVLCCVCCKLSPCPVLCCVCCKLSPCPVLCCVCCKLSPCPVLCCVCCLLVGYCCWPCHTFTCFFGKF